MWRCDTSWNVYRRSYGGPSRGPRPTVVAITLADVDDQRASALRRLIPLIRMASAVVGLRQPAAWSLHRWQWQWLRLLVLRLLVLRLRLLRLGPLRMRLLLILRPTLLALRLVLELVLRLVRRSIRWVVKQFGG